MEIKRRFEWFIETNRRYVIRQSAPSGKHISCAECGEPMLTAERAAGFFGITQRRLFRIIEADAAHFIEADAGAAMICITSMAEFLNGEMRLAAKNKGRED